MSILTLSICIVKMLKRLIKGVSNEIVFIFFEIIKPIPFDLFSCIGI